MNKFGIGVAAALTLMSAAACGDSSNKPTQMSVADRDKLDRATAHINLIFTQHQQQAYQESIEWLAMRNSVLKDNAIDPKDFDRQLVTISATGEIKRMNDTPPAAKAPAAIKP